MKKIAVLAVLLAANMAWAKTATLVCTTGESYETFKATLDYSRYQEASGLFDVKDASITDNYASAELTCVGARLENVSCVGFWFRTKGYIAEVSIDLVNNVPKATHQTLGAREIDINNKGAPWACEVN